MNHGRFAFLAMAAAAMFAPLAQAADEVKPAPAPTEAPAAAAPANWSLSDAIGLTPALDPAGIKVYGWVDQSFTWNHSAPTDRINPLRVFDVRSNDYALNQIALNVERALPDGKDFAFGGKVELMYGSDMRFIHSKNLANNISGDRDNHLEGDTLNFDPTQFYGLLRAPIGNGLTIKFGKYVTTLGAEVIDAPGNALFSHSYAFGFAIPFTHTGAQFDYAINDNFSVYYGIVRGWDVFGDNNNTMTHMFGLYGNAMDKKLTWFFNAITGPERAHENTDYRTVLDLVATYKLADAWTLTLNGDFGNESNPANDPAGNNWYAIAGYLTYTICEQAAATLRYEYFRDETATRLGFTGDITELTLGLDLHPIKSFQNLRLRPEARWDHSYGSDHPFNGGTKEDQFTLGADLILTF
jgi:hypothetical protein